ncbi:hypothetical protein [Xanthomonas arboricola]|uniref:hypothetical protein n=1 Tax=Xanthomonas arboricola TaxID=56448 RepID=UPI00160FCE39|nr:hypothetical protein [Xanthomonas arboricola]MBB3759555.1 hypothetical protein [Xanthomonas arboricola]
MTSQGRSITVDEYLFLNVRLSFTAQERDCFEESATQQFELAKDLVKVALTSVPDDLKESLLVNFTSQSYVYAQVMGSPPLIMINVSMGLIEQAWRASQSVADNDDIRRSVERLILTIVVGHELTHAFSGHTEDEPDPQEGRSAEAHADFFSGLYVTQLSFNGRDINANNENLSRCVWIFIAMLILVTLMDHEVSEEYHSSPVRFMFMVSGQLRWLYDRSPELADRVAAALKINVLVPIIEKIITDERLRDGMLSAVKMALASEEDIRETIERANKFRGFWYQRAALMEPIRHLLDLS